MTDDAREASLKPRARGLIGPFTARQLGVMLAIVVGAAGILFAVTRPIASTGATGPAAGAAPTQYAIGPATEGLRIGDRAPELHTSGTASGLLSDLSGKPISLAALRGHPVWLSFWASWCPPCQAETPVVRDLYNSYKDRGLVVVAISVQETSAADVASYARQYDLPYTIGADLRGDVFREYRVYGLPTQFFLDPDGIIRSVVQGPVDYNMGVTNIGYILPEGTDGSPGSGGTAGAGGSPAAASGSR